VPVIAVVTYLLFDCYLVQSNRLQNRAKLLQNRGDDFEGPPGGTAWYFLWK